MLKTLMKHEMRATAKTFIWLYIAFAAIVVVNTLTNPMATTHGITSTGAVQGPALMTSLIPSAFQGIAMALYALSIAAMGIVTLVVVIMRFFRNLLGDEGYLMMTLPVSREQNILSKLLIAVFWNVCTSVLIILSFLLIIAGAGVFDEFVKLLQQFFALDAPVVRWVITIIAALLVATFSGVLMLYAAMGTGPNLLKNRVGGSILAYILIYIVSQFIVLGVTWGAASMAFGPNFILQTSGYGLQSSGYGSAPMNDIVIPVVNTLIVGALISEAIVGIGCWFLTRFMLKRKLNLA